MQAQEKGDLRSPFSFGLPASAARWRGNMAGQALWPIGLWVETQSVSLSALSADLAITHYLHARGNGVGDTTSKGLTHKWRPVAQRDNVVLVDGIALAWIHNDHISKITFL